MPTPGKFLRGRVETDYNISMSWEFEANLSDLPPEGINVGPDKLGSVPLRGDWSFSLCNQGDDLDIEIEHGQLACAAFGERVTVTFQFAYFVNGALRQIEAASWGAPKPHPELEKDGTVYTGYKFSRSKKKLATDGKLPHAVQSSLQQYRFSIMFTQESEDNVARLYRTPTSDSAKALQLAKLSHSPLMDVRLLFKRADDVELELWTTADFLGKASAYYKALFASGGTETVTRSRSKRARGPSVVSEQKPFAPGKSPDPKVDWEDSDDETDNVLVERNWMNCTTRKQDTADFDYQQTEVRETAYSTMCAVLLYLQTGHINFAPLRSSHALPPDEVVLERKAALVDALEEHPTLPPPVSPKSVYRLAHLLEREELQTLALDSFASNLTISGAAVELFSPISLAYDKLRKVVVAFVVKNWKEVKATEAWQTARAKVTSEPTESAAQVTFDLFAAIENV